MALFSTIVNVYLDGLPTPGFTSTFQERMKRKDVKKGQCPYEKANLVPKFPAYISLTGAVSHGHLDPQGYQGRPMF